MQARLLNILHRLHRTSPDLLIRGVLEVVPADKGIDTDIAEIHAHEDVAILKMGNGWDVRVSLLGSVARTDVVQHGRLSDQRMLLQQAYRVINLLVVPGLEVRSPILLSPRVSIAALTQEVILASLQEVVVRYPSVGAKPVLPA